MIQKISNSSSSEGLGFIGALTILFIALKLLDKIDWPWLWVLAPIWITVTIIIIILIIILLIYLIFK